jgi:preprotein translocase subunit YajC
MDMIVALSYLVLIFQGQQPGGGIVGFFLPMIFIFGIFYFLIIRPQQKRQRQAQQERDAMLEALKAGDKVVTTGGIYGTIVAVRDNTVQLRIAQSVSVEVLRTAIAGPQSADVKELEASK